MSPAHRFGGAGGLDKVQESRGTGRLDGGGDVGRGGCARGGSGERGVRGRREGALGSARSVDGWGRARRGPTGIRQIARVPLPRLPLPPGPGDRRAPTSQAALRGAPHLRAGRPGPAGTRGRWRSAWWRADRRTGLRSEVGRGYEVKWQRPQRAHKAAPQPSLTLSHPAGGTRGCVSVQASPPIAPPPGRPRGARMRPWEGQGRAVQWLRGRATGSRARRAAPLGRA
jgi:hypothetical protein